jgi:hypothetical protein
MLDRKVENRATNVKWRITTLLPFSAAEVPAEGSVCLIVYYFSNSVTSVLTQLLTVLLTLWLLGEKVGRKKSSKNILFQRGRRDSNPRPPA